MIDIVRANHGMILGVLANLRTSDAKEMAAAGTNTSILPDFIMQNGVFCFCARDPRPIAVWGVVKNRPGVGAGFAFGTDQWPRAVIPMLRQIRGFVLPFLIDCGFHRIEAAALASRSDVAALMSLIHAEPESVLRGYGTGGEDFISYRWLADEYSATKSTKTAQHLKLAC
jgi:hypothetical protein